MAKKSLEERVAALERQVAELRTTMQNGASPKDWRSTIGMFSGDEVMQRIGEEALKYREADRRKTRPRNAKKRQRKP